MKVFVYCDYDGHIGVYDINSEEQVQGIFRKVVSDLGGDKNEIEGMDLDDIQNYLDEKFDFVFDRSGGGRAYIVDVKTQMNQFVEQ